MMSLLVLLSSAEIVVWGVLLFTLGFVLHFWWMRHQYFPTEVSKTDTRFRQEAEKWKHRFFQETDMLSRELDRLRTEFQSIHDRNKSLQAAFDAKEELLTSLKQERSTYRELLTASLQPHDSVKQQLDRLVLRTSPEVIAAQPFHLNGDPGRTLHADLHQAELRIEELELKLMDQEDALTRLQTSGGAGDINEELLEKISELESKVIQSRSIVESQQQLQTRTRELEEQLTIAEQRRQSLTESNTRLAEENQEQYAQFKAQLAELNGARSRLAQFESLSEELNLLQHRNQELRDKVRELGEYKSKVEG